MKKTQTFHHLEIIKIGHGGIGVAKAPDGKKILIKGGILPGSIVDLQTTRKYRDYYEARVTHIHTLNTNVIDTQPLCPHFANPADPEKFYRHDPKYGCGGCKLQMISYAVQLKLKQELIDDSFRHITDVLGSAERYDIVPSPEIFKYRNKIEFSFGKFLIRGEEGFSSDSSHWNMGFHKQGEFSKVLDVDQCFLVSDRMHAVFDHIKKTCKQSGLPVYDQKAHQGFFRHLVMREGTSTGQILVNLVIADQYLQTSSSQSIREEFQDQLQKDEFLRSQVHTFLVTINNGLADTVKTQDIQLGHLRGDGVIFEELTLASGSQANAEPIKVNFRVGPFSFFQTNTKGAEKLFSTALHMVGKPKGTILDLYCGTGTIGLSFLKAGKGESLLGIEIVPEAIEDAKINAHINGLADKAEFLAGKAESILKDPRRMDKLSSIELVIVDPPRDGMHPDVVSFLCALKKSADFKLCYISCNPVTLARDLRLLTADQQFTVRKLQPVDMFPQTHHVEVVTLLS